MSYRYFSVERPINPGTFPQPVGNPVDGIHNNQCRTFYEEIGREAWGYIDYAYPLMSQDVKDYELVAGKPNCIGCAHEEKKTLFDQDACWGCNRHPSWKNSDRYIRKQ